MNQTLGKFLYSSALAGIGVWVMPAHPDFWSAAGGVIFGLGLMGYIQFAPVIRSPEVAAEAKSGSS